MKARYIEQERQLQIMQYAAEDMAQQFLAAACYAMHMKHLNHSLRYRKKKVKEIFDDINAVLTMPKVCGKYLEGTKLMETIQKEYGIDFNGIKFSVETQEECRKRERREKHNEQETGNKRNH